MAIIGGDLAESLAESAIAGSGFPPGKCLKAVRAMAEMVRDTGYGQMMDVSLGGREEAGEAEIEMLQRYKTAIYTFDGPLRIGAILAGASEAELGTLRGYGIPVGISFQIIDDLLGFFGDRKRGGASDISDLKEGKRTKVLLDLVRICNEDERAFLRAKVGSRDLTLQDAEGIRDLARKYAIDALSREKARKKVDEGIAALEGADLEASMKGYLVRMAQDLLSRA